SEVGPIESVPALAATVEALAAAVKARQASAALLAELAQGRAAVARGFAVEMDRYRQTRPWHIGLAAEALAPKLRADMVVIGEVSSISGWVATTQPIHSPGANVPPSTWGAMGFCVPGMIGAAIACPDKKVIGVAGDCSLFMSASDLGTLLQLGRDVVLAIDNNSQIGIINNFQVREFGRDRTYGTHLGTTNFARVAEAFGATGIRVEDPADLDGAWDRALSARGPVVLDLVAGHEFPWGVVSRLAAQG
ncbi:MAG: thiamine pyrophosphate-binding protein, partial [Chloroflexi bacterium]|nr:thiamine pyrophosphate-binding protein [Chloroflexota bacterium]